MFNILILKSQLSVTRNMLLPMKSFIPHALMALVFLISGLILNMAQLLIYAIIYPVNKNLYRRINYYLIYSSWSQIVAVSEWLSGTSCNLCGDEETLKHFGKEHSIVVMNHKYEVDWLMCWIVCDKLGMLGNAKTVAKSSLKKIPVIGWGWVFGEMIFLERNWEQDCLTLGQKLDTLVDYENPIMLLLFCEGTRFTSEKHRASMEVAKAKGLPQLKHHLLPRTKGFNFSVKHLKGKINAIYDVQVAFPKNSIEPTIWNILCGHEVVGDMYVRRIPMSDIPTESDDACSAFLYEMYQQKDNVMDEYLRTNKFPGRCIRFQKKLYPLVNSFFWSLSVGVPFLYYVFRMLSSENTWVVIAASSVIVIVLSAMYVMIGVTKADKGSSYGKVSTSPTRIKDSNLIQSAVSNGTCTNTSNVQ